MATKRTHLYVPLVDEAGDLRRYAKVRIYLADGVTPYAGLIYRDRQSTKTYGNPWIVSPALVSVWFPTPIQVVLGVAADQNKPEVLSEVYDVTFDGSEAVSTVTPVLVEGTSTPSALLSATDADSAFWHPLRVDHEHEGVAPSTAIAGRTSALLAQAGTFTGTAVLGADAGGEGARSSLRYASMLGLGTDAYGRGCIAAGSGAYAAESLPAPWHGGAVALGRDSVATDEGVALGASSDASATEGSGAGLLGQVVTLGFDSGGVGPSSISVGPRATAGKGGIAIGRWAGSAARGNPDSIGIGSGVQYGLPGDGDLTHRSVLLGSFDPTVRTNFSWDNPDGSQSESPLREFTSHMQFAGSVVQFQRHLQWVINAVKLQVAGDVTLGSKDGLLGFYGKAPIAKQGVGDDEPGSGIVALDNLIYALRDLGLIKYRAEAVAVYQALDISPQYLDGDQVAGWREHSGSDTATSVGAARPTYASTDDDFNRQPVVVFDNGYYRRGTKPLQELRGAALINETKHFAVVAQHTGLTFGFYEGMFNLSGGETTPGDDTVFMSDTVGSGTWQIGNTSKYAIDGLNQTANRSAVLPFAHVYRMTNRTTWPHARPVIGGPRDQDASRSWDNFSGAIAEIVGMDDSWEEPAVVSMERGLMFKYGIGQSPAALETPAKNFIVTQHDPDHGTFVFWQQDYSDAFLGRVYGRAVNVPKPIVFTPFISIFLWFDFFLFRGSLLGNWGNIFGLSINFEVEVSVVIGDFDGDGDFDSRIDISEELDINLETRVGSFSLNNNFSWSMGQYGCQTGHKVCRIVHRQTREVFCISGHPSSRYADTEVRVYSTKPDGSLLLEGTSPLWGDGTFGVRVTHAGHKVARIYEVSTGNLLGTTEYQEKALPRTTIYATDDPDVSAAARDRAYVTPAALTAMAFCEMDLSYRYRARHVLKTLAGVANVDGSLNDFYSAALPARTARGAGEIASVRGALWTILATLRYWGASGDGQFLAFARQLADYLISTKLGSGSIPTAPGQTTATTADNALAYFAFRDLGAATGVASYTTAAQGVRTSLLANHWVTATQRFGQGAGDDSEAVLADVYGGLFLLAIGDRARARATVRHLKRFRVKNASISAPHYSGASGLIGYKPYAELGTTPYVNPPAVIEQMASWAAVLFKTRFGEPVGDDVISLMRWQATSITGPNASGLFGAQFLSYNANATAAPYGIRARPHLGTAAWAYLLTKGGRGMLVPDPLPAPVPTGLAVAVVLDRSAYRAVFRYTWAADPAVPLAAFEAVPEFSNNAGQTWSPVAPSTVTGQIETVRDNSVGTNGFSATWSVPIPDNTATIYRVRLRLRNAVFGNWITSATVSLPAIT